MALRFLRHLSLKWRRGQYKENCTTLLKKCSKETTLLPPQARSGPNLVDSWQNMAGQLCHHRSNAAQRRRTSIRMWSIACQQLPNSDHLWSTSRRSWPNSAQTWSTLADSGPTFGLFRPMLSKLWPIWPTSTALVPDSTRAGRTLLELARLWQTSACVPRICMALVPERQSATVPQDVMPSLSTLHS